MNLPYIYHQQVINIIYKSEPNLLDSIRDIYSREGRDRLLHLNRANIQKNKVLLQSSTSTTTVDISFDRANFVTKYFDSFVDASSSEKRLDYMKSRFGYLLDILSKQNVEFSFVGIVNDIRIPLGSSVSNDNRDKLKLATLNAVTRNGNLYENGELFDFTMRASRVIDNCYSNIWINWYQERTFEIKIDPDLGRPIRLREWDSEVSEEGVEFKYDRNNKYELYKNPDTTFTKERFLEIAINALHDTEKALNPIYRDIVKNYTKD